MRTLTNNEALDEGFEFKDGEIIQYSGDNKKVVIPSIIGGEPVERIFECAFNGMNLISVHLPDTIKIIGERAFANNDIIELVISDGVEEIAYAAFENNNIQSNFKLPESLRTIGSDAFRNAVRATVLVKAKINAFKEYNPFSCNPTIWYQSESGDITNYLIIDNKVVAGSKTLVDIPEGVTTIKACAYEGIEVDEIHLPSTLESIEFLAFDKTGLNRVYLKSDVEFYSDTVFPLNCIITGPYSSDGSRLFKDRYKTETFGRQRNMTSIEAEKIGVALDESNGLLVATRPLSGTLIIPDKIDGVEVTGIHNYAFMGSSLTSVILPSRLRIIGDFSFANNMLEDISLPQTLTHIGRSAFEFNKISELYLPESLMEIKENAFSDNTLEYVELYSPRMIGNVFACGHKHKTRFNALDNSMYITLYEQTVLFDASSRTLVCANGENLPAKFLTLGDLSLSNIKAEELFVPMGVTTLGSRVFENSEIGVLYLPPSLEFIAKDSFKGLRPNTTVMLHNSTSSHVLFALRNDGCNYSVILAGDYSVTKESVGNFNKNNL